ncbi:hypothetical protein J3A83DRAFT_4097238 [Scleroderma citrinum]
MSNVHSMAQSGFGTGTNELLRSVSFSSPCLSFIRPITAKSPLDIVECVLHKIPPRFGAGTGLFTRALLAHPDWASSIARLRAVEPSEGMRNNIEEKMTIEDGTFERTVVPDGWADWSSSHRSAFHWCPDYDKACVEFARILKKDGAVVFMWNSEDGDQAGWVAQLRERIKSHEQDTPQFFFGLWRHAFSIPSYLQYFQEPKEKIREYYIEYPYKTYIVVSRMK